MGKRRKLGKAVFGWVEKMRHPFWIKVWPGKKLWWFLWEKKMQCSGDDTTFGKKKKKALGGIVRVGHGQSSGHRCGMATALANERMDLDSWYWAPCAGKGELCAMGDMGYELKNGGVLLRLPHFLSYNI